MLITNSVAHAATNKHASGFLRLVVKPDEFQLPPV